MTVSGPRANESFYPTQTIEIGWTAIDDDSAQIRCSVSAIGTAMIAVASDVATTSGVAASTPWAIEGAAPGSYRIQVSCTDENGLTGVGISPTFHVSAPPQQVRPLGQQT